MGFTSKNHCVFCILLIFILVELASQAEPRSLQEALMYERFEGWAVENGRVYKNDAEKAERFLIFKENVNRIESFNAAANQSYKLSVNNFADFRNEEFKARRNGLKTHLFPMAAKHNLFKYANFTDVPTIVDWREKGVVTPIKDQGECGSCWAFSTVASVEGITKLRTGELISLSEQELVDCVTSNKGCGGGFMDNAFEFIQRNRGLTTEANYPYKGVDGVCNVAKSAAIISGYEDVPPNKEMELQKAVANQPVSVAIDAGGSEFRFYSSGIFTGSCGTELNHGVTVVGYGVGDDGRKYWMVKNSWGDRWGEQGYIRIERDVDAEEGRCGIAMKPSYPTA